MKMRKNLGPTHSSIFPCTYKRANATCMTEKPATHTAYALRRENPAEPLKRERRVRGYWIEIGHARIEPGGSVHHLFLDRLPVGGFSGHVYLSPVGVKPPEPEPQPERPSGEDAF